MQKSDPSKINKYKIRGDGHNGLAAARSATRRKDWHDYWQRDAVNAALGRIVWKFVTPEPGRGGVTTTATGLASPAAATASCAGS